MTALPIDEPRLSPTRRAADIAGRVLEVVASLAVVAILIHVIANVILRTFFNSPIPGTNELVGNWYLPIIAFVGFVVAKTRREHIEATLLYDKVSPKNQLLLSIVVNFAAAVALAFFAWFTFVEAQHGFETLRTSGVTGVPIWPVLWIVPFGFGVLAVMYALDAIGEIRAKTPVAPSVGS